MLGTVTGYAVLNAIPSIFFSAPDDRTVFVVLPGQKTLLQPRRWEAALLTRVGGLGGAAILVLLTPVAPSVFSALCSILQPRFHWLLAAIAIFMLMSEWPKGADRAKTFRGRLAEAWSSLTAGLENIPLRR